MYCTPYFISGNVVFLKGTCFIVQIALKYPVYTYINQNSVMDIKIADLQVKLLKFRYVLVIRTNKMHSFLFNDLIQLYFLRHVSNN
jgi:hypothetical protein